MGLLSRLKPRFWDYRDIAAGPYKALFNFRRIWKLAVLIPTVVSFAPLLFLTVVDYNISRKSIESDIVFRTSRLVSNTWRNISFFLNERKLALDFIDEDNSYQVLQEPKRLAKILDHLKNSFGAFQDIGVIDAAGKQIEYVGPYALKNADYEHESWFREVVERGIHISEVFLGYRNVPHLVVAVRHDLLDGSFYVLRATLDTERFNSLLSDIEIDGKGDAFLINRAGVLQTPSRFHGKALEKIALKVPEDSHKTRVYETENEQGARLVVGYRNIPDTPFILLIVKQKEELIKPWHRTRVELIWTLITSMMVILIVILAISTYLVNRIFIADHRRVMTLHEVEYANKMASIGRLAAGVAHEINNPLAIISEKAGLIKDLFMLQKKYSDDTKLIGLIDSIILSVERCGKITKRLLGFARHTESSVQPVVLKDVVLEVLGFLGKEAEHRSIEISVEADENLPSVLSDRGKLQQIFLNIINNAFAAMENHGRLDVTLKQIRQGVSITIADTGTGIPEADLKRVFEPFFSTKTSKGGTGLGLSITYGLVNELGGKIEVESVEGEGTAFTISLPLAIPEKEKDHESASGR